MRGLVLEGFRQLERQRAECAIAEARARADDRHLGDFLDPSSVVGLEVRGDGIGRGIRHRKEEAVMRGVDVAFGRLMEVVEEGDRVDPDGRREQPRIPHLLDSDSAGEGRTQADVPVRFRCDDSIRPGPAATPTPISKLSTTAQRSLDIPDLRARTGATRVPRVSLDDVSVCEGMPSDLPQGGVSDRARCISPASGPGTLLLVGTGAAVLWRRRVHL